MNFQTRVQPWLLQCFGPMIAGDREERNHRFLEESIELVQACGCSRSEAHQLVDYVFNRPVGEPQQEAGGVMVTLAALCLANGMDMHDAGDLELARIWTKVEQIRAKQAAKPKHSPLPAAAAHTLRPDMRPSTLDVIAERTRQIVDLGRDANHDDSTSDGGDLAHAAACYALNAGRQLHPRAQASLDEPPTSWPANWHPDHWKPKDPRRDLVRAGALILAEIDRIDRKQVKAAS